MNARHAALCCRAVSIPLFSYAPSASGASLAGSRTWSRTQGSASLHPWAGAKRNPGWGAGSGTMASRMLTSCSFPSETSINVDGATQIEQGVHLDGGLVGSKPGPGEQRQAEVDGGGVQGIDGVVEIETERLVGLPGAGDADQHLSEVGEDVPVVRLVGVGQGGA